MSEKVHCDICDRVLSGSEIWYEVTFRQKTEVQTNFYMQPKNLDICEDCMAEPLNDGLISLIEDTTQSSESVENVENQNNND